MMWTIILLALMNISTILTILYKRHKADGGQIGNLSEQAISENPSIKFSGRYFRDKLELTPQQMARFREFNPVFRRKVQDISYELSEMRYRMLMEMSARSVDSSKLNHLCDSIGYLHAGLKRYTYGYYLDLKNICNKEQQLKLEHLFNDMFAQDILTGHKGKMEQAGRRRGKKFNN